MSPKAKKKSKANKTKKAAPRRAKAAKKAVKKAAKKAAKKASPRNAAAAPPYRTVTPFLSISGANRAIEFYKNAFGASERVRMEAPDGSIMHAELEIGDSVVMVSEAMAQPATRSNIHLYVPDCDASYARAVAAGASPKMPLADMFWGDRYGTVNDPFGNQWSIATHKEDVSPDEMKRRMAELPPPAPPPTV